MYACMFHALSTGAALALGSLLRLEATYSTSTTRHQGVPNGIAGRRRGRTLAIEVAQEAGGGLSLRLLFLQMCLATGKIVARFKTTPVQRHKLTGHTARSTQGRSQARASIMAAGDTTYVILPDDDGPADSSSVSSVSNTRSPKLHTTGSNTSVELPTTRCASNTYSWPVTFSNPAILSVLAPVAARHCYTPAILNHMGWLRTSFGEQQVEGRQDGTIVGDERYGGGATGGDLLQHTQDNA